MGIKLEFGKYYVVEVSFKEDNPIHRAILTEYRTCGTTYAKSASATLSSSGYEASIQVDLNKLAFFRVVHNIPELATLHEYPNRFKLPKDAVEPDLRCKHHKCSNGENSSAD